MYYVYKILYCQVVDFKQFLPQNNCYNWHIHFQGQIDYEKASIYTLSIIAKDKGADSMLADATVIVKVTDVNDHPPDISVNTLAASGTNVAEVAEDEPV